MSELPIWESSTNVCCKQELLARNQSKVQNTGETVNGTTNGTETETADKTASGTR